MDTVKDIAFHFPLIKASLPHSLLSFIEAFKWFWPHALCMHLAEEMSFMQPTISSSSSSLQPLDSISVQPTWSKILHEMGYIMPFVDSYHRRLNMKAAFGGSWSFCGSLSQLMRQISALVTRDQKLIFHEIFERIPCVNGASSRNTLVRWCSNFLRDFINRKFHKALDVIHTICHMGCKLGSFGLLDD